ncbi:transposase [Burkholderia multivorans]|uniref:transposase n=1 Tax=Burkholderia multivorans TaxID=87883 RepID=UPI003B983649
MFPETTVQTCIVHLIRNSLDFASWKDRKSVAAALKEVYRAPSAEAAAVALDAFDTSPWGTKYPPIAALWRRAWDQVIPFYAFAPDKLYIRPTRSSRCTCSFGKPSRRAATSRRTRPHSS